MAYFYFFFPPSLKNEATPNPVGSRSGGGGFGAGASSGFGSFGFSAKSRGCFATATFPLCSGDVNATGDESAEATMRRGDIALGEARALPGLPLPPGAGEPEGVVVSIDV